MSKPSIAVVGAGISGLACARALAPAAKVTVFDKARGPGGRLTSKRLPEGRADIGAPFFAARDPRFQTFVKKCVSDGAIAAFTPRLAVVDEKGQWQPLSEQEQLYVGTPYMHAFLQHVAETLNVKTQTRIGSISIHDESVSLQDDAHKQLGDFDAVVMTAPLPQTQALVQHFAEVDLTSMFPQIATWTLVGKGKLPGFDGASCHTQSLDFVMAERCKPGRDSDNVIVHMNQTFTEAHLEESADQVLAKGLSLVEAEIGVRLSPVLAHRWRYARPADSARQANDKIFKVHPRVWVAGDGFSGGQVEGAFLSGLEAAEQIVNSL